MMHGRCPWCGVSIVLDNDLFVRSKEWWER
jgi:hypothetical protein